MAQRRSAEEIKQLVGEYQASGLTQVEYSRQTGIVLSTLRRYVRRHVPPEQRLMRVKVEAAPEPGVRFVLALGNGRRIESSGWIGDAELVRLIRVAESA